VGPVDDNILLMQSIQITDKFGFQPEDGTTTHGNDSGPHEKAYAGVAQDKLTCLNGYGKFDIPFRGLCEKAQSSANQSQLDLHRQAAGRSGAGTAAVAVAGRHRVLLAS